MAAGEHGGGAFSKSLPIDMVARAGYFGLWWRFRIPAPPPPSNPFARTLPSIPKSGSDLKSLPARLWPDRASAHASIWAMSVASVPFAFALAALLSGRLDAAWARWSRPGQPPLG